MEFQSAFDFDDLPSDDEPDLTLPPKESEEAAGPEGEEEEEEEDDEVVDAEDAEATEPAQAAPVYEAPERTSGPAAAVEAPARRREQAPAQPVKPWVDNVGQADIAAAMANKRAEECFLIGPHGSYLDEFEGQLRMVEWSFACPWLFRSVGSASDPRYLISQRDLYLVVVDGGERSLRLKAEPGKKGLWALRPVPSDPSRCFLLSSQGTFLASLDDKDQTLYMSGNAEEWEQWRCIRVKETAPAASPAPVAQQAPQTASGAAVVAFGLGDFDVSGLVCGSSPHLPVKPPAGVKAAPGQAGAKELGGTDAQGPMGNKEESPLKWDGPRANFQVREEVLPMCMEREDMEVQDVVALWEEWGCKFAGRLKLAAPPDYPLKWLPKSEIVPGHPAVVRLEGPGAVLDSVTVALKRNGKKLAGA